MLSWTLKAPIITAWSAPGTALLIPLFPALTILLPFGLNAFKGMGTLLLLVCGMLIAFLVFKRLYPRYSVVLLVADANAMRQHIPDASLVTLAASHISNIEAEAGFNRALLAFLR